MSVPCYDSIGTNHDSWWTEDTEFQFKQGCQNPKADHDFNCDL